MSSIYIQEPPTNGKVRLETTVGDIEIELWSKECPKACRNFIQLCMECYYDGTIFHRVVPGFIVQGGDPTGTGLGGQSIYDETFKDEFHSRLRFVRRGLLAMANGGKKNDNGSQFFFTLDKTPELQDKHTIFGQVAGDTLFNMLKLAECQVDKNERPEHPHKIRKTTIISNPFPDIVPRIEKKQKIDDEVTKTNKKEIKATKNFSLLSFGDEAEEDEEMNTNINKSLSVKGKSTFDLEASALPADQCPSDRTHDVDEPIPVEELPDVLVPKSDALTKVQAKLKANKEAKREAELAAKKESDEEEPDLHRLIDEEKDQIEKDKLEACRKEFKALKKSMREAEDVELNSALHSTSNKDKPSLRSYYNEMDRYSNKKATKKSSDRERSVYEKLERFKAKLESAKHSTLTTVNPNSEQNRTDSQGIEIDDELDDVDPDESEWLGKIFDASKGQAPVIRAAIDVHVKDEDRYDLSDPRNPLNKRRREKKERHGSDQRRDEKRSKR